MDIPVHLEGNSPGVLNGGTLRFPNRKLRVKALPANLPDYITANISELKIGSKLFVTELMNDAYTIMHPENTVVVQVRTARAAIVEVVEEGEEGEEGEETEEGAEATAEGGDAPASEAAPQE